MAVYILKLHSNKAGRELTPPARSFRCLFLTCLRFAQLRLVSDWSQHCVGFQMHLDNFTWTRLSQASNPFCLALPRRLSSSSSLSNDLESFGFGISITRFCRHCAQDHRSHRKRPIRDYVTHRKTRRSAPENRPSVSNAQSLRKL